MSVLTTIGGIPLFSTSAEAESWASARGLQGTHTHVYQGQTGYMGGSTHNQAASTLGQNTTTTSNTGTTTSSTSSTSNTGGY